MVDPRQVAFFCPKGLRSFKQHLFDRIGDHIKKAGGRVVRHNPAELDALPPEIIPIVGCSVELSEMVHRWKATKRPFVYWDRGAARRVFATWLPRGTDGGYYRWIRDAFQLQRIGNYPDDRWKVLDTPVTPWSKGGKHIVIAAPTFPYSAFHRTERWTDETVDALARVTDRPLMIRAKPSNRPLSEDLQGAHALVAHGSNAAVEAVIMGCPVFVDKSSAAALVGKTDLKQIETPIYPDRQPWLNALSYSQFSEPELINGTLFRLLA